MDIDGVLADQVGAALKRIEKEYGQRYSQNEVDCWNWSFSGRELWLEVAKLLHDPEYVLSVPVMEGSQAAIQQLSMHDVCVVTARRPETEGATKQWLSTYFPCLTVYHHARTGSKHTIASDVLIDDFDMNILEFVKSDPYRHGILFMHPWSINGAEIMKYSDRVHFCTGWQNVIRAIGEIDVAARTLGVLKSV